MTNPTQDTRDRVIRMEERLKTLEEKFDEQSKKIDEMYNLLTKAKGAKLTIIVLAAIVGGIFTKAVPIIGQIWQK
ncbi:hypothetical protein BG46_11070 [Brucella anthropi]|uniref:hypothetical protein n=1 Tax=Brucella anthropi TaxID=529 RepID=UPI00044B3E45|nr:hypothetical protein [Brucella anthropi]EXL07814.1 hypothetical protein BG46_11070 [Brucella anthropi]RRY13322.1 hypothetical protein EGJ58_03180 [Brucella anthropi]